MACSAWTFSAGSDWSWIFAREVWRSNDVMTKPADSSLPPKLDRYSRQILFPGIGREGQERLLASRVTLCGCGALGTVLASTLARAGVGFLRVIDRDFIETNNLQRQ